MKWLYDCGVDFLRISVKETKKGIYEMRPKFVIRPTNDLMIRGSDFYAIWLEELGLWSTDEQDALRLIDRELDKCYDEHAEDYDGKVSCAHMWDADSGMIDKWHKYCQKQMRDSYHMLDEKLIFSNETPGKSDYASKVLPYPLQECATPAYDELVSTLYSPKEREKIEWAIGSVINGDSKKIQKFMVFYGAAGTGKSTVLNIIQQLFEGYYSVFDAKALGSSNNSFALEAFKTNPLVAIQHDGDLSRIEDNTRLNSLVSHEMMTVNEKFKSTYSNRFKSFLFMGTNKPVKITDGRSGLIRRLIDVSPTGNKVQHRTYQKLVKQIEFELGGIAMHCKLVYEADPDKYDNYIPTAMLDASNDFYNFVQESYFIFKNEEYISFKQAWEMYKHYCEEARVAYPFSQRVFKEELKNYFREFDGRIRDEDGSRVRNVYRGFRTDKFANTSIESNSEAPLDLIKFTKRKSIFDKEGMDYPAQYAKENGKPKLYWKDVTTTLSDLDTSKLHYVKVPKEHIVIDFDLKDENGEKSLERNINAASKWPTTYAELSKSGSGVHLHYIYNGDTSRLDPIYDTNIEVKVFTGGSSLRRMLTKCNGESIATISSGLPLKGEKKMINFEAFKNEERLRSWIGRNLKKEYHAATKPSIDFIKKGLDEAYESGMDYDVSNMRSAIFEFASNSSNNADYCMELVGKMKFKSKNREESNPVDATKPDDKSILEKPIVFFDIEVFKNVVIVCWKKAGEENPVNVLINPKPDEIFDLVNNYRLVGFNNRRYDNHILYAIMLGYTPPMVYDVSQKIINKEAGAFFGEAYSLSWTDVLDFIADKKSLKKYEIEYGIPHMEFGHPWDKPLDEKYWDECAEYCKNDVLATEEVFNRKQGDFTARMILAELGDGSVNDTTNGLTTKIIFGKNRHPKLVYTDLATGKQS